MASKLGLYSNFYLNYEDDKGGCFQWSWTIEVAFQLFLFMPFIVLLYNKAGPRITKCFVAILFLVGIFVNYEK